MSRDLSKPEAELWLSQLGIVIDENRDLVLAHPWKNRGATSHISRNPSSIVAAVRAVMGWIISDRELLLWVKNWETHTPETLAFYESIRSEGTDALLIEAPGQLIHPAAQVSGGPDPKVRIFGLLYLIMSFDWDAYLVAADGNCIYMSDEFISIFSPATLRLQEGVAVLKGIGLSVTPL